MDGKVKTERRKNPREGANPLSAITFSWILRTFWVGYRKELQIEDLYKPLKEHTSGILGSKISRVWEEECEAYEKRKSIQDAKENNRKYDVKKKVKEPSLMKALAKCFGVKFLCYGIILAFMEIVLKLFQPLFLGLLIRYCNRMNYPHIPLHSVFLPRSHNSSDSQVHENEDATRPLSP